MTHSRLLALGDSYTIGEGVPDGGRWPEQLTSRLIDEGFDLQPARIIAQTGWTTDELAAAMDDEDLSGSYRLVSLLIGVNNQYRGRDVANFRSELDQLIERARSLGPLFMLSIPDWTWTPFFKTTERDFQAESEAMAAYNAACADAARRHNILYFDITPGTRRMQSESELVTEDGLHPSATLYSQWVEQMYPVVRAWLEPA